MRRLIMCSLLKDLYNLYRSFGRNFSFKSVSISVRDLYTNYEEFNMIICRQPVQACILG